MTLKTGDLLENITGNAIIAHVCNNVGKFNKGFAQQVRTRYPIVYDIYMSSPIIIGQIQSAKVANKFIIVNMIAMQGVYGANNRHPLSYKHLRECLLHLKRFADMMELPVHMPKIGAGLAHGDWETISNIICEATPDATVWDLPHIEKPPINIADMFADL